MPPLHLRQEFPTLKAFKEALHTWAIEAHFEPRILKSDTGRVRVGCKRDANCPFVIRCNWERKGGREPLARVTVLRDKHTCLNGGVPGGWDTSGLGGVGVGGVGMDNGNGVGGVGGVMGGNGGGGQGIDIRQDGDGNIVGGARVLGPVDGVAGPVLPKVQRNSASRLPFLMEILPRLMNITKETTPNEIRECLLREYGAEVHLQQCRRAKTEILKKRSEDGGEDDVGGGQGQGQRQVQQQGNGRCGPGLGNEGQVGQVDNGNGNSNGNGSNGGAVGGAQLFQELNGSQHTSPLPFSLHTATGVVTPAVPERASAALMAVGEAPVRCPYCINHRWMTSIKDAVEHMSMHVTV